MSRNSNIVLAAIGGAAAAALITRYLSSDEGREMLDTASNKVKDLTNKATEFANKNLSQLKNKGQGQRQSAGQESDMYQPS